MSDKNNPDELSDAEIQARNRAFGRRNVRQIIESHRALARWDKIIPQRKRKTTKADALNEIIRDARSERSSRTSYRRVLRALKALELTPDEQNAVLVELEYHDPKTNQPWPRLVQKETS